jgi:hypothetical protein
MPCHQSTYFLIIFEHIYPGKNGGFTGVLTNNWRGAGNQGRFFLSFFRVTSWKLAGGGVFNAKAESGRQCPVLHGFRVVAHFVRSSAFPRLGNRLKAELQTRTKSSCHGKRGLKILI